MTAWILLIAAGLFEVVWATAMKASNGFTHIGYSILTGVTGFISFWLLAIAMKTLPMATAYVVWVGIGAVGAAMLGILMFGDAATPLRIAGIALVAAGVTALKFA